MIKNNNNIRWILLAIAVLLIFSMQNISPKEAVADIDGQPCDTDSDCPCWGTYMVTGENISANGIGIASCEDGLCDMTYCVNVVPVGEWVRDNPFNWIKGNPLGFIVFIALLLTVMFWPKQV